MLGIVFLIRHARSFGIWERNACIIFPLALLALYPVVGHTATIPFGFIAAMPIIFLAGPSYENLYPVYIVAGCLLNALGFLGMIYLFILGGRLLKMLRE